MALAATGSGPQLSRHRRHLSHPAVDKVAGLETPLRVAARWPTATTLDPADPATADKHGSRGGHGKRASTYSPPANPARSTASGPEKPSRAAIPRWINRLDARAPCRGGRPAGNTTSHGPPGKKGAVAGHPRSKGPACRPGLVTATPDSCWRSRKASRRAPSPASPCTCPRLPAVGRRPVAATSDRRTAVVHQPPRQASPERGHTNDFSACRRCRCPTPPAPVPRRRPRGT